MTDLLNPTTTEIPSAVATWLSAPKQMFIGGQWVGKGPLWEDLRDPRQAGSLR
jgi:hypothetical protein